ncbi:hypothetical protein Sipo8835_13145 [Streptomyces ipomoeae]|jgi:hypothetical protein|uniref:Uncharacterized protein n=3 Tax=Streptomyces ipomoeae TaxID=103232 RepID=L1KRR1_9ACTN|nr:hypothetical protein [Streptomyces ipomoeae]EKX63282.1 hypothetical protein STRIP9103_05078 [Streptomyces ipomoeae 91-03]MDX2824109.1 hypothetical protein [Streptomyces ipomoeae]MDX2842299.1 hypothetical protein [Streptomyces ipomoeae]MDX2938717.1 hypothetical protein [Streptomyces ipomoeae]TQE14420.1 hypothetical protein SipoB123_47365 [Streptomyces ipomoeae]
MFNMVKTLVKTFAEQYARNQQLKRDLKAQRDEQERRWREEDRAVLQAALAANRVALGEHNGTLRRAAGVSYITLRCHEDTWTFMARTAFGVWEPTWTQSTRDPYDRVGPGPAKAARFLADPNLPPGRVIKGDAGMQDILLSGHNLVLILDALYAATNSELSADGARCKTLYDKLASLTAKLDPSAAPGRTTGVLCRIDDSMNSQYVSRTPGGGGSGGRGASVPLLRKVPSPAPATR